MHTLVLASQSPRRKELLERAGFEFTVASVEISEIPNENLNLHDQIRDLARRKAEALVESPKLTKSPGILLLSSDTVVVLDDEIIGKPRDAGESELYVRRLSGRTHRVITGICLWDLDSGRRALAHEEARVEFRALSDAEVRAYVATGEGLDKAGAYGAQGLGAALIARIDGALDCVMGLPVPLVEKTLNENGWRVARRRRG